jgi:hypothetical protein
MTTTDNPKRKQGERNWDDEPSIEASPQNALDYGERLLWCSVLKEAVAAAMRGDNYARYWLMEEPDGLFVELCLLLSLDVSIIRQAVLLCEPSNSIRNKQRNQYSVFIANPGRPIANATKPPDPAPLPARPAIAGPVLTPYLSEIVLEPASAVAGGWITGPYALTSCIPLPAKRRKHAS